MSQIDASGKVLAREIEELRSLALEAAEKAYAPYSGFRVGAAIELDGGDVVTGCNVENASYRLTTCAEQTAISSAVTRYGPNIKIRTVVIVNLNKAASQPCGACRQTIHEFSEHTTQVYFPSADGSLISATIGELLPYAFQLNNEK